MQINRNSKAVTMQFFAFPMCFISVDNTHVFSSMVLKFPKAHLTASHIYISLGASYLMFRHNKFLQ